MSDTDIPDNLGEFDELVAIIARLRGPGGCPWDREQTHSSLKGNLTEEAYEVLDAIDRGDMQDLCEELGDVLLQVVLHAQIARDDGGFEIRDVIRGISTKLIHRHPHVFGDAQATDAQQVIAHWETLKREEGKGSLLSGLPKDMPALSYAQAVQRRVARVGFDWEEVKDVVHKLAEEVAEFEEAVEHQRKVEEFGDILFTLANVARRLDIDLEAALRGANERFYERFSRMEEMCKQRGISLAALSLEEQDALWEEAKRGIEE
jgi:tetrapyrrole methylase family protein/MazG family protein